MTRESQGGARLGSRILTVILAGLLVGGCKDSMGPTESIDDPTKPTVNGELLLIGPEVYALLVGETIEYSALVHDCSGFGCGSVGIEEVTNVDWSSSDPEIASVSNGRVTAHRAGSVVITGTVGFVATWNDTDEVTANLTLAESFVPLASVSAGGEVSCGKSADGTAYCWGDTTDSDPATPNLRKFGDELFPRALQSISNVATVTATTQSALIVSGSEAFEWGGGETLRSIAGAAELRSVTAGRRYEPGTIGPYSHACGIADDDETYCWGSNDSGQLGTDSVAIGSQEPVRVQTDLRFASVTAGGGHTCGLTAAGLAYCWGNNEWGQLGDASTTTTSHPVAVVGGQVFSHLSAGTYHTWP